MLPQSLSIEIPWKRGW